MSKYEVNVWEYADEFKNLDTNETFYGYQVCKLLEQKDQRIAELEAKLAESEKQIKDAREAGNMAVDSWCKNRRKYEAQIAEMQNKSFILYSMLYETLEKQGCENVASQIDQMTGWTYDKEADWLKGNRNYDQLKQQLAEKDKEISEVLAKQSITCLNTIEKAYQDKISFAIEQLEKVEEILWNSQDIGNVIDNDKFLEKLNYLIKSLKGEVYE